MSGLIGIKCGTSRLGNESGGVDQVTVIKVFSNYVTNKKTYDNGETVLQLASIPEKKNEVNVSQGCTPSLTCLNRRELKSLLFHLK